MSEQAKGVEQPPDIEVRILGAATYGESVLHVSCVADGYPSQHVSVYVDGDDWTAQDVDAKARRKYRHCMRLWDYIRSRGDLAAESSR